MIKVGDMVDIYDRISRFGDPISRHHIVKFIDWHEDDIDNTRGVAYVTGRERCVTPKHLAISEGWPDLVLEDIGLCNEALGMIAGEDANQVEIWGRQSHTTHRWMTILTEEVGELAKAILEDNLVEIEKEATQVATVALKIAWMARRENASITSRQL